MLLLETCFILSSDSASNTTGILNATSAAAHAWNLESLGGSYQT